MLGKHQISGPNYLLIIKEKREIKLTGGGKASSVRDETAAAVTAIIQDQVEPLDNRYDDDKYECIV